MPNDTLGLLNSDDWSQMRDDFTAMRKDNEVDIVLRREQEGVASHNLAPQTVRVVGFSSRGKYSKGSTGEESRGRIVVLGAFDMDIYPEDRFTVDSGTFKGLYRVELIRPNRRVATMAEAELVE
jgi:hypothetical protein